MSARVRVKKKRSFLKRHRASVLFLACICVCVAAFIFAIYTNGVHRTAQIAPPARPPLQKFDPTPPEELPPEAEFRVVYPYSVISGGVRTGEELAAHIATDPVVADHYKNFKISRARVIRADKTRMMYASYRVNDQVYWTKKEIRIPEGETLVTDGECEARTRCGNQVSVFPQEPVAEEEPILEAFDIPQMAVLIPPKTGPLPTISMLWDPIPPVVPYPFQRQGYGAAYYRPLFPMTDVVVPEPGTLTLLITGLAALCAYGFFRKK
jgi:hypothetical protein